MKCLGGVCRFPRKKQKEDLVDGGIQAGASFPLWLQYRSTRFWESLYASVSGGAKGKRLRHARYAGKILWNGLGRDKDEDGAQAWFSKAYRAFLAAEQQEKKKDYLQYRIGKLFSYGFGAEQSHEKAAEWFEKAVEEGESVCRLFAGRAIPARTGRSPERGKGLRPVPNGGGGRPPPQRLRHV